MGMCKAALTATKTTFRYKQNPAPVFHGAGFYAYGVIYGPGGVSVGVAVGVGVGGGSTNS